MVSNPAYSGLRRRRYDRAHEQGVEIGVETRPLPSLSREAFCRQFSTGGDYYYMAAA